jgi:hypothetical protein
MFTKLAAIKETRPKLSIAQQDAFLAPNEINPDGWTQGAGYLGIKNGLDWQTHYTVGLNPAAGVRDITYAGDWLINDVVDTVHMMVNDQLVKDPYVYANAGDLQGWKNFHFHVFEGTRYSNFWSALDGISTENEVTGKVGGKAFSYMRLDGTRSMKGSDGEPQHDSDVFAINLSPYVINRDGSISSESLRLMMDFLETSLQLGDSQRGSMVMVPEGDSFKVYYMIQETPVLVVKNGGQHDLTSVAEAMDLSLPPVTLTPAYAALALGSGWDFSAEGEVIVSGLSKAVSDSAFKAYRKGTVKKIILSGQNGAINLTDGIYVTEKDTMRRYLINAGMSPDDIIDDPTNANSTTLQAQLTTSLHEQLVSNLPLDTEELVSENGYIVFDTSLHARRTKLAFENEARDYMAGPIISVQYSPVFVYDSPSGIKAQLPFKLGMRGYIAYEKLLSKPLVRTATDVYKSLRQWYLR